MAGIGGGLVSAGLQQQGQAADMLGSAAEKEQAELLDSERTVIVPSNGARGWPHSMPIWFTVRDGEPARYQPRDA